MRKLILVASIIIIISVNFYSDYVYADSSYVTFLMNGWYHKQEKSSWCWVAAADNAVAIEGRYYYSQAEVVKAIKGSVKNVAGSLEDSRDAADFMCDYEMKYYLSYNTFTYETIKRYLNRKIPLILGLMKSNSAGTGIVEGHMVVLVGYSDDTYVNGVKQNQLVYYDPMTDKTEVATYEEFVDVSKDYGTYKYYYTIARCFSVK